MSTRAVDRHVAWHAATARARQRSLGRSAAEHVEALGLGLGAVVGPAVVPLHGLEPGRARGRDHGAGVVEGEVDVDRLTEPLVEMVASGARVHGDREPPTWP